MRWIYATDCCRFIVADEYLENIPAEHNPIFRERRVYDGNYDKNFIRAVGNLGVIDGDKIDTIWNIEPIGNFFDPVTKNLHEKVSGSGIATIFTNKETVVGHLPNVDNYDSDLTWEHFYYELPNSVTRISETTRGNIETTVGVFKRSLTEVNTDDINTVIELINANSIYRGAEHLSTLNNWLTHIDRYNNAINKENYLWETVINNTNTLLGYRNTVIGSLIVDLYDNKDLESAVKSFEAKVAPTNYKRPNPIVTPKMIAEAQATFERLGLSDALYRRFATRADIPANHKLFTSQARQALNVFDDLAVDAQKSTKKVDATSAEDVTLEEFIGTLPELSSVELLPTVDTQSHRMVLTTSDNDKQLFKWNNPFAWTYLSGGTDAIKERVKSMGGDVDGDVRISLSWNNADDLDLHLTQDSSRRKIYYGNRVSFGGKLDVDMNISTYGQHFDDEHPVENITFENIASMKDGTYTITVDRFTKRFNGDRHADIQIEVLGDIKTYRMTDYGSANSDLRIKKSGNQIEIINSGNEFKLLSETTKASDKFTEVHDILLSPNFWDGETGNKHVFLITDDFEIDKPVAGFYNEFLHNDLGDIRRATAAISEKLKISDGYDTAARGYGYSSTLHDSFIARLNYQSGRKRLVKVTV